MQLFPITDDAAILGLLAITLGAVFYTTQSENPRWRAFYRYVPSLLLCYFIPSLYNTFGLIDAGSRGSTSSRPATCCPRCSSS
jgi:hypothetical protein